MATVTTRENDPALAWTANCSRKDQYTRLEPIPSRRLIVQFIQWPPRVSDFAGLASDTDLEAAELALEENGVRNRYSEFRKELGL